MTQTKIFDFNGFFFGQPDFSFGQPNLAGNGYLVARQGNHKKMLVLSVVYREGGGWGYGTRRRKKTNNQKQNGTINKLQEGYSAIVALQSIQQV